MKLFGSKVKKIAVGIIAASALFTSALPVGAWSNGGSFTDVKVSNTGYHVFTLNQRGFNNAMLNITSWGAGRGNVEVDVYYRFKSTKATFSGKKFVNWEIDPNESYGMDAICTASLFSVFGMKDYRTISGEYGFY